MTEEKMWELHEQIEYSSGHEDDELREDQLLRLSDRDWELASSTLESPPEPNEALKNLLKV